TPTSIGGGTPPPPSSLPFKIEAERPLFPAEGKPHAPIQDTAAALSAFRSSFGSSPFSSVSRPPCSALSFPSFSRYSSTSGRSFAGNRCLALRSEPSRTWPYTVSLASARNAKRPPPGPCFGCHVRAKPHHRHWLKVAGLLETNALDDTPLCGCRQNPC